MTQEFVTLPREVVEQALKSMMDARRSVYDGFEYDKAATALSAALEQPDHSEQYLDMVPGGWKLVPAELTQEMIDQLRFGWSDISIAHIIDRWKRTVDAAPQPPEVEQPKGEQPYVAATIAFYEDAREPRLLSWNRLPVGQHWLYTHPQNLRCKSNQKRLATLWGYVKAERTHGIGHPAAAPQQFEQEPVATLHCTEECYVYARATDAGKRMRFEQPIDLYTYPQPQRELLTREKIRAIQHELSDTVGCSYETMARAIEAAHNIK